VLYQTGIGTGGATGISDSIAGTFGYGVDVHVLEAYTFFSNNYEKDDQLFLFGFSRGAFTARAIAALICNAGLLKKKHLQHLSKIYQLYKDRRDTKAKRDKFQEELKELVEVHKLEFHKEVLIYHLGLWDTVGSLGIPRTWISNGLNKLGIYPSWNEHYNYHDTSFPNPTQHEGWKAFIIAASQALSLEENRISFAPTLLYDPHQEQEDIPVGHGTMFHQVWFPGVHTDVGGGYERAYDDISDITFAWMVDRCSEYLKFRPIKELHEEIKKTSLHDIDESTRTDPIPTKKGWALSDRHDETLSWKFKLGGTMARTPGQYFLDKHHDELKGDYQTKEYVHVSVRMRMLRKEEDGKPWRPAALEGFELKKNEEGYYWHKVVEGPDKKPKDIKLREWGLNYALPFENLLRTPADDEILKNEEESLALTKAEKKSPSWLASWLPWNWGK
ncbi:hypothetical protein FRC17_010631, partial [Serendipita sp. 399]